MLSIEGLRLKWVAAVHAIDRTPESLARVNRAHGRYVIADVWWSLRLKESINVRVTKRSWALKALESFLFGLWERRSHEQNRMASAS